MHYVSLKKNNYNMHNKTIYLCTLFDKNYIDKGIVLYTSIKRNEDYFKFFILAMDDKAYDILKHINDARLVLIKLVDLEDKYPILRSLRNERTAGEICWTCTSLLLEYVFETFKISTCTYIDSDLAFYSSPRILLEEFEQSRKDVGLTPHRFPNTLHGRAAMKQSGKYCVEFNTFKNNAGGRLLLKQWKNKCLEECSIETGGDQRYLTDWGERYENVYDYKNIGGGVAPWNVMNYYFFRKNNSVYVREGNIKQKLVFYHYQGIQYSGDGRININCFAHPDAGCTSHRIVEYLYIPYLNDIERVRAHIRKKYKYEMYIDGCDRRFSPIEFHFKRFIKGLLRRLRTESITSVLDFIFRVIRKREDILRIDKNGNVMWRLFKLG